MTTDYKILGQAELGELALDNSTVKEQVVYEVPANTQFTNSSTSITNTGDSAHTYSIAVVNNEEKSTAVTNVDYQTVSIDKKFVAIAENSKVLYSSDGINWTQSTISDQVSFRSVTYGNGKFVAIGHSHTDLYVVAWSEDGVTWFPTQISSYSYWTSVTYGGGKFVAVSDTYGLASYSTDGITWTDSVIPDKQWTSVTYGGGKFVAVSSSDFSNSVAYSTDGISWTEALLPTSVAIKNWNSVAYGAGKFVAVPSFSNDIGVYSSDGINWSEMSMPSNSDWLSVIYAADKFIAVANNSRIGTSIDGITWTQNIAPGNLMLNNVAYGDGKFIALGRGFNSYLYSTDGVTWTEKLLSEFFDFVSIVYAAIDVYQQFQQEIAQSLNKHKIIYNKEILAGETHTISGGLTLNSGDQIRAKSTSSDIIVNVYGAELS